MLHRLDACSTCSSGFCPRGRLRQPVKNIFVCFYVLVAHFSETLNCLCLLPKRQVLSPRCARFTHTSAASANDDKSVFNHGSEKRQPNLKKEPTSESSPGSALELSEITPCMPGQEGMTDFRGPTINRVQLDFVTGVQTFVLHYNAFLTM